MKRNTLNTLLGAMLATLALGAQAETLFLTELLSGGSMTVGDKKFDRWNLINYDASDASRTFDADNISVTGIGDGVNSDYGLKFTVSNGELSVTGDDLYAYVDLHFGFRVTATDPNMRIVGNGLEVSGGVLTSQSDGSNDLGFYIHEKVGTVPGLGDLSTEKVEFSVLDDALTSDLIALANFNPRTDVWVTKNILVWAVDSTDSATLTEFTQTFAQKAVVPEPATLALFGLGLLGLGLARRRG